jgi:hypothetical protein
MNNTQAFIKYLTEKGKKQAYIDMSRDLLESFHSTLGDKPPSSAVIDKFVRSRWSGYISRDKETYKILNDYADFSETEYPLFSNAFREHIRDTFEGEARKAMRAYKNAIVYIPKGTKVDSAFLCGLNNDEFADAFQSLQELIYDIYNDIECGSPFDWGWSDWKVITADGLNHNRVMLLLEALTGSGRMEDDKLVVDKKYFGGYGICKPIASINLMLKKFMCKGFQIEELENKDSLVFTVSYPDVPNLITVLFSYFRNNTSGFKNHVRVFSYRFVENPAAQNRETFFLAKTDGEPANLREIYFWLYDEAGGYGYLPAGCESLGGYAYKKGKKEWLHVGSGHSYHEPEFLHSPNYEIAIKVRFHKVFQTHPETIDYWKKRFPNLFIRDW